MAICQAERSRTPGWLCTGVTLGPGTNSNCLDNWLLKMLAASLASCQCHVACRKWMQLRGKRKNSVGGQDATMSDEVNWPFAASLTGYVPRTCRRGSVLYFRHVHACPNKKQRALLGTVKRDAFLPPCVQTHSFNCYRGTSVSLLLRHRQAALDSADFRFARIR